MATRPHHGPVSSLFANHLETNPGNITIRTNSGTSISSTDIIEEGEPLEVTARRIASGIMHELHCDPKGVSPFPKWDAKSVTQTMESGSNALNLILSVTGPSNVSRMPWTLVHALDNQTYDSVFSQGGTVETVKFNDVDKQTYSWILHGVSIRLVWPWTQQNMDVLSKNPTMDRHSLDLDWCLSNLPELEVRFHCL